jgi:hypothetical protein
MSNVVSFDDYTDDRQIAAHQLGLPRVILEGRSDLSLFKEFWFTRQTENFEFMCAGDLGCGDGCTAVARAVAVSRERDSIPAYGIVDRDRLFRDRDWTTLFEVDEAEFLRRTEADDAVYTTMLWEIEAYLLEPDLIPHLARSHTTRGFCARDNEAIALDVAVEELEHMLKAQRLFAVAHENDTRYGDRHFVEREGDDLHAACDAELDRFAAGRERAAEFDTIIAGILDAAPTAAAERIRYLLRYVNTKRLIHRLIRRLRLFPDIRGFLATMMYHGGRQPAELTRKLEQIRRRAS